jgi:hypothetical protein
MDVVTVQQVAAREGSASDGRTLQKGSLVALNVNKNGDDYLRWRMRERMRRFLRPTLRRPLPRRRLPISPPVSGLRCSAPEIWYDAARLGQPEICGVRWGPQLCPMINRKRKHANRQNRCARAIRFRELNLSRLLSPSALRILLRSGNMVKDDGKMVKNAWSISPIGTP